MKITLISLLFFFIYDIETNPAYEKAMAEAVQQLNTAGDAAAITGVINNLERIGQKEKDQWLPKYYMAYGYTHLTHFIEDPAKKDQYLDLALKLLDEVKQLQPDMSEWHTLKAYVQMMKITINPQSRGQELSPLCFQNLEIAKSINSENPRVYLLQGQLNFGVAMFFNQSIEEPCTQIQEAISKFETYKPSNVLAPNWGREIAAYSAEQCKNAQKK